MLRHLHLILHKVYNWVTAIDSSEKCVFQQYLQSKWLEFNESLYVRSMFGK